MAWTSPVPDDLEPHYPRYYRRYNPLVIAVLKFLYKRRVAQWCKRFPNPGSALELGCGDGFMLNALRGFKWQVAGTERTDEMARFAREKFGLTIYVESDSPIPAGEKFDLIIMFHVLEHLQDPVAQLQRAAAHLREGGAIIVGVPNFASWQSRYARDQWINLDVPRHLVHFSPQSIEAAANAAGLTVSQISFKSFEHDPYSWVQSILNVCCKNRNRLTSLLMRASSWRLSDLITIALAALLTPLAITLAMFSWLMGKGAIMESILVQRVAR
jgi:SAM-dependent methyltransferase